MNINGHNNAQINRTHLTLDDINSIVIGPCVPNWPCQHRVTITLKNVKSIYDLNGYEIYSIITDLAIERINPNQKSDITIKQHFEIYSLNFPHLEWFPEPSEVVLNRIFP